MGEDPFLRGDPPNPNVGLLAAGPNPGIFETLTTLTPAFGLAPGLALRWEPVSDTVWRFTLRKGVRFHDGTPFDARAAREMLESVARRQNRPRGLEPGAARITADDVIEVALILPNMRLAEQLANPSMGVAAPGKRAGNGADPQSTPTGTGPFKFASYAPGSCLTVVANEEYWGDRPRLQSLTFRFSAGGDASRLLAIRQVEVVGHVPYSALANVSGRTDRVITTRPARSAYLLLNVGGIEPWGTLQDDGIRRAVALALDRRAIAAAGWALYAEQSPSVVPPVVLGTAGAELRPIRSDPEAARKVLSGLGWTPGLDGVRVKDGRRLTLTLLLARPGEQAEAAQAIIRALATVGIAVEILDPGPDPTAPFGRVNQATFDLFFDLRYQEDANPCALCRFFSIRPGGQLTFSGAVIGGPEVDTLFERAYLAKSAGTARALAADMMQVLTTDRIVAVPLASLKTVWLLSSRIQDFEPAPLPGAQRWNEVWLSQ